MPALFGRSPGRTDASAMDTSVDTKGSATVIGRTSATKRPDAATEAIGTIPADALVVENLEAQTPASSANESQTLDRPQWRNRGDFLMVLMGYAIGIGNLWRFPFLCGKHGGGAFVVVYLVCLCLCAFPLFFLELVIGQIYQTGPVQCFRALNKRFEGVAYIAAWMNVWILGYYQMVIAWALVFFCRSFGWASEVPWSDADTKDYFEDDVLQKADSFDAYKAYNWQAPAHLLFAVIGVWVITYLCLVKGIHSAGKVAYFTVIMPFVLITILLIKAASLEGAGNGIAYYLKPKLEYIFRLDTWSAACGQILFSLSPATGAAIALASYNPPNYSHLLSDALLITVSNSGFSIFAGFVVFSVCGNLAFAENTTVEAVAQEGAGLTFVVFPRALAQMPTIFSWFFFFTLVLLGLDSSFAWVQTLVTYAMDHFATASETRIKKALSSLREEGGISANSASVEQAPNVGLDSTSRNAGSNPQSMWKSIVHRFGSSARNNTNRSNADALDEETRSTSASHLRERVTGLICLFLGLTSLVYASRNGVYMLETVDHFAPTYCLLFSAFLEFILFGYVVGVEKTHCLIVDACCRNEASQQNRLSSFSNATSPNAGGTGPENVVPAAERTLEAEQQGSLFPPKLETFLLNNRRILAVCIRYVGPVLTGGLLLALFITDVFLRPPKSGWLELIGWSTAMGPIVGFFLHAYRDEIKVLYREFLAKTDDSDTASKEGKKRSSSMPPASPALQTTGDLFAGSGRV
ncbi:unnamed protein product [Amoebophrya sp. A120]|nr:unnamed protein product [Amoebophrya sp. A120]|eukprot:GSA120T00002796001.1